MFTCSINALVKRLTMILFFFLEQTFARKAGSTSEDIDTEKLLPVVHGASVREHARYKEQIFPVSTAKKKMCSFKVCTEEKSPGWACLTSTQKESLYGPMEHLLTSVTGQNSNQTILPIKIVYILWVFLKIMTMNGMMSTARTATYTYTCKKGKFKTPSLFS